jgi:hypothetical protein
LVALTSLIEAVVVAFGCWTLAYHLSLLLRLPACSVWLPFIAVSLPVSFIAATSARRRGAPGKTARPWLTAGTAALSLGTGVFTLMTSRPDMDDISFFHRALVQAWRMDEPFVMTSTIYDVSGIPNLSGLHTLSSYEPLMAIAGWELCGDPLWFYQNMGAFVVAVLLPVVLVLWFRSLGLRPVESLAAVAAVLIFLLTDGNTHRSFGNISLVRLWQGKCIVWTFIMPAGLFFCDRFLRNPSVYRFLLVFMTGVAAVGLSNSGMVLFAALAFCASVAYLLTYGFSRRRLNRALVLNWASIYCVTLGMAFATGLLGHTDMSSWTVHPSSWRANVNMVIGGYPALARDILLLALLPFLVLPRRKSRFLIAFTLTLVATVLNPLTGRWVMRVVTSGSYWRFLYVLPLPLCAGLVVRCFVPERMRFPALARFAAGILTMAVAGYACKAPALADCELKGLSSYKLPRNEATFTRRSARHLAPGAIVLAPEDPAWVMGLMNPSLRFVSIRIHEALHVFRSANRAQEAALRVAAQGLVTDGQATPDRMDALRDVLGRRLDAIVLTSQAAPAVIRVLEKLESPWQVVEQTDRYLMLAPFPAARDPRTGSSTAWPDRGNRLGQSRSRSPSVGL